jgi:hypothetical protein
MKHTCRAGPEDLTGTVRKHRPKSTGLETLPKRVQGPGRKPDQPQRGGQQPAHRTLPNRLVRFLVGYLGGLWNNYQMFHTVDYRHRITLTTSLFIGYDVC